MGKHTGWKTVLIWTLTVWILSGGGVSCSAIPKVRILHDPLTAQEHLTLGVAYESQGKLDLAISEYEAALRKDSKELGIKALVFLGNGYAQKGEYRQAERYYRKALAREPDNGQALNNLAWVYFQQRKKLREAEEMVRQALEGHPAKDSVRAGYLDTLSEILIGQARFSEALNHLQEAERLAAQNDPSLLPQIYSNQARIYESLGQLEKAREARGKANLSLPPNKQD